MITKSKIYKEFIQHGNSCILASYAIASNYFTDIPIRKYFEDYCRHFNISIGSNEKQYFRDINYQPENATLHEFLYDSHFHREYRAQNIPGITLLLNIHNTSLQDSFLKTRENLTIELISNVFNELTTIENLLKSEEGLLVSAFNGGSHTAVFGFCEENWFTIETRLCSVYRTKFGDIVRPNKTGLIEIDSLNHFGNLNDGLLFKSK